jgi:hypothetical protein
VLLALPSISAKVWGGLAFCVLAAHLTIAVALGRGLRDLMVLFAAPAYLLWKLSLLPRIAWASRRGAAWVRTPRHHESGKSGDSR